MAAMMLALIPGLVAVALFVATLALRPPLKGRVTALPSAPADQKA